MLIFKRPKCLFPPSSRLFLLYSILTVLLLSPLTWYMSAQYAVTTYCSFPYSLSRVLLSSALYNNFVLRQLQKVRKFSLKSFRVFFIFFFSSVVHFDQSMAIHSLPRVSSCCLLFVEVRSVGRHANVPQYQQIAAIRSPGQTIVRSRAHFSFPMRGSHLALLNSSFSQLSYISFRSRQMLYCRTFHASFILFASPIAALSIPGCRLVGLSCVQWRHLQVSALRQGFQPAHRSQPILILFRKAHQRVHRQLFFHFVPPHEQFSAHLNQI